MKHTAILFILASILLNSCGFGGENVRGNGNIRTEQRTVSAFNRVEVHGNMHVNVSQGDLKPVQIEGDENLMQYVEIVQQGKELTIKPKDGYDLKPSRDMNIYLTSPEYKSIEVSGACDIIGQTKIENRDELKMHVSGAGNISMEVDVPEVTTEISGSGTIKLKGETKHFKLDMSGAAKAQCYNLLAENTTVDISGAGDAEVYASVKLDAEVSGAGSITYKGNAKSVKQEVSGAGSVRKVD